MKYSRAPLTLAAIAGLAISANAAVYSFNLGDGNPAVSGDVPAANNPNGLQITGTVGAWANIWIGTPSATNNGVTLTFTPSDWGGTVGDARGNGVGTDAIRNGTFLANEADIPWSLTGLTPNAFYDMIWDNKRESPGEGRHPNTGVTGFDAGNGVGASAPLDADRDQNFIGVQANGSGTISGTWFLAGGEQDITAVAGVQVIFVSDGGEDTTPPVIETLAPFNGETDVAVDTNLVATFDEDVRKGSGNIVIRESGGAVFETIPVASVTVSGAGVTITPGSDLEHETGYYVEIEDGAIEDLAGNDFGGISGDATWNFTTAAARPASIVVASFNMGTNVVSGDVPAANNPDGLLITGTVGAWANIWTGTPSATDNGVTLTFSPADWGGTVGDARGNGVGTQAIRNGTFLANEADIPWTLTGLTPNAFYDMIWYNKRESPGETRHPNTGVTGFDAGNGVGASAPLDADRDQNFIGVQADGTGAISGIWFLAGGAQDITAVAGVQVGLSTSGSNDYTTWASNFPGADLGNPHADYDGDGVSNDDERLFGLDPTDPSSLNPISVPLDPAAGTFSFTRRDPALTGLSYAVWTSTDLVIWAVDTGALLTPGAVVDEIETVAVELSAGLLAEPKLFLQVRAFVAPPVTAFEENFDGPDPGWTSGANAGDTGTTQWELGNPAGGAANGPAAASSPDNCYGTNIGADYGLNTDIWLRTPPIDLTAATAATLAFKQFRDIENVPGIDLDFGSIRILAADGLAELAVLEAAVEGADTAWQSDAKALPAAAFGEPIVIEFRFQSDEIDNLAGWYLDDVVVTVP